MTRSRKIKIYLSIFAAAVLAAVSFFKPEYAENIARAFVMIIMGV